MVFGRIFLGSLIGALCFPAWSQPMPKRAEASVLAQLRHGLDAVRHGRFDEACGAADLVLLKGAVRISADPGTQSVTREAIRIWGQALNGAVYFELVSPGEEADISVSSVERILKGNRNSIGFSHWRRALYRDGRYNLQAEIDLATNYPSGSPIDQRGQLHAALHELGHILGLDDSPRAGDVMGPIDPSRPICSPQPPEIAALRALRSIAEDLREEASNLAQMNLGGYNFDREIG